MLLISILLYITFSLAQDPSPSPSTSFLPSPTSTSQSSGSSGIVAVLANQTTLSQLNRLLTSTNTQIISTLSQPNSHTFLAPTNEAFNSFYASSNYNPLNMNTILNYHILNGIYTSNNLSSSITTFAKTLLIDSISSFPLFISILRSTNGTLYASDGINNATIISTNTLFNGGIIHTIDRVLIPPIDPINTVAHRMLFKQMPIYWNSTKLTEILKQLKLSTIFVPTDDAFDLVSIQMNSKDQNGQQKVISYHTMNGTVLLPNDLSNGKILTTFEGRQMEITQWQGDIYVDFAKIISGPIFTSTGVIYTIDALLNPDKALKNFSTPSGEISIGNNGSSTQISLPTQQVTSKGTIMKFTFKNKNFFIIILLFQGLLRFL